MALREVKVSGSARLYLNMVRAIAAIIIIAGTADYFIRGGIPQVAMFRQWMTYSTPLSAYAMSLMSCRSFIIIMRRRGSRWWKYFAFFATFIPLTIIGLVYGASHIVIANFVYIFVLIGAGAIISMAYGMAMIQAYIRAFWATNWLKAWLVIVTVIGIIASTPMSSFLYPAFFAAWDNFLITNVTSPSSVWLMGGFAIATLVQITRVVFFREDLIPEV